MVEAVCRNDAPIRNVPLTWWGPSPEFCRSFEVHSIRAPETPSQNSGRVRLPSRTSAKLLVAVRGLVRVHSATQFHFLFVRVTFMGLRVEHPTMNMRNHNEYFGTWH